MANWISHDWIQGFKTLSGVSLSLSPHPCLSSSKFIFHSEGVTEEATWPSLFSSDIHKNSEEISWLALVALITQLLQEDKICPLASLCHVSTLAKKGERTNWEATRNIVIASEVSSEKCALLVTVKISLMPELFWKLGCCKSKLAVV